MKKKQKFTFVFALIGAPFSNSKSTTCSCPERAAQCNGVNKSRVRQSIIAPRARSNDARLVRPHLAATCNGLKKLIEILIHKIIIYT